MELEIAVPAPELSGLIGNEAHGEGAGCEREAVAQLYRRHSQAIARYIHRRVGDAHLTEDLVADVFTIAVQALPRYRDRGLPVQAWLYRIATNRVNRWARRERKRALKQLDGELVESRTSPPMSEISREQARAALLTLAPKHQSVLALHYLEGMPIEQVAQAIGCRVGTVKSRLARGREAMRRRLQRRRSQ